jgi:hypothetical protein
MAAAVANPVVEAWDQLSPVSRYSFNVYSELP